VSGFSSVRGLDEIEGFEALFSRPLHPTNEPALRRPFRVNVDEHFLEFSSFAGDEAVCDLLGVSQIECLDLDDQHVKM
ncbi:MAG TPA: hypothetical protein VFP91_08080, partial [Vicinamibacterales bacterium]|nr:hypothetical protein [Vicinamibacterales bacterium]